MKMRLFAAALVAGLFMPAVAQDDGGNIIQTYYVNILDGHQAQFDAGMEAYKACIAENGGQDAWTAWSPVTGDLGAVNFRSDAKSWADFDAEDPADEACAEVFATELLPHTGEVRSGFRAVMRDLSMINDAPVNIVYVIDFDVDDLGEAIELITAFHETSLAGGTDNFVWSRHVTADRGWDLSVALLSENFAGMAPTDGPGFWAQQAAHHGEEAAAELKSRWMANLNRERSSMFRRNEAMSYTPAELTD